jgi:hypothetical protein
MFLDVLLANMLVRGASGFLMTLSAAPADCAAQQNVVPVSIAPVAPDAPKLGGTVPNAAPKGREPAVLLPECKVEPRKKRKKRLSDYPMA